MVSEKLTIINKLGLHMRPASNFVQLMNKYQSNVKIHFSGKTIDGKSIMAVMSSCIKKGAEIEIECEGPDEEEAVNALCALIESNFGE